MDIPSSAPLYQEEYFLNSRGIKLFTCRWLPANNKIKALVFLCHGYAMECSIFMKGTGIRLAKAGYAVFGIDYEGHGKSQGLRAYIKDFNDVVEDCAFFFKCIRDKEDFKNKARFFLGESMGGTVALRVHRKEPEEWNGAILIAPMCKISDKLKPSKIVVSILSKLALVFPKWQIVPTNDIIDAGFKDPLKREEIRSNCYIYQGKPRLRTGLELLNASIDAEERLSEVTLPFLVLHGEADVITDPSISRHLFDTAQSFDKTLTTYPGMWHGLTFGESEDDIDVVFNDILSWLSKRIPWGSLPQSPVTHSDLPTLSQKDLEKRL